MSSKYKEYSCIIIMTIVHGIFTYRFLGSMPYIAFGILSKVTISAFFMWVIYGITLYLITQKWVMQNNITVRCCIRTCGFGIIVAIIKEGFDLVVEKSRGLSASVIKIVVTDQITNFVFGILLIVFLFLVVAKRRVSFSKKSVRAPFCTVIAILVGYVAVIGSYLYKIQIETKEYNRTEVEICSLDHYFGMKILDINVWFYVIFYIVFWWFMRRLTKSPEESRGVEK